ncbi:C-type lectin domain family 4 member M-like isoform X1 [Anabas testudineus]|uniref:C-type lectin domain family 4 member M-like isoform X1 n=1 Tax=Anabas testudineus TaxID=64144 RepID=UPI000E45EF3E|nr:C-type lectin domain family 4 member M-like isoform X1 [Anabas testudineus]
MDALDLFVNVEEPSESGIYWKRKTDSSEILYQNEDKCHTVKPNRITSALSGLQSLGWSETVKKSSWRAAAVVLGLLCLLLLIGLITLASLYIKGSSKWEMEMVQLQTSYKNLTKEKDQLQTSYNNLTKEKDQLQTSYNNLTKEKDQLQTSYNNLTKEKDQLQTSHINLTKEKDQLQTSYENLTKEKDQLQTSYNNLTKEKDQLQTSYKNLTKEKDQLQTSYENLTKEKDQLQTSYNNLTKEQDQLQTSYNNLTKEKDQLQTSYNNLTKEQDQLQTSYNNLTKEQDQLQTSYNNLTKEKDQLQTSNENLTKEKDQLQTSYRNLTEERDQLQKRFEDITNERNYLERRDALFSQGWVSFRNHFYYISSGKKSWQQSRADCLQKGADLVIINSHEEQEFTKTFKKVIWIGLTDMETERKWKWVDGTPLTTSYWSSHEPNGVPGRDEDCAEIKNYDLEESWNDESCHLERFWICEKILS